MPRSLWQNLSYWEKRIDERARLCRDCGNYLESIPFDITVYQGDNEPS